jgi:hypothetical protein
MRNKVFEAFLIIVITGLLLAGFSYFVGSAEIPLFNGNSLKLSFIDKNELLNFSYSQQKSGADSLIRSYREDSVTLAKNQILLNKQIAGMTKDSLKIREIVNSRLNFFLTCDTAKRESVVQKFIKDYLNDESDRKKKIIKEELMAYLNLKNIKNEFLINPEKDGNKALDNFFAYLMSHKDTNIVRIAHYGDSQLEGDRVTSSIRDKMHARFGGSGIGFVPFMDITDNLNLTSSHSGNWKRYTVFHDRYYNSFYGIAGVVYRFGNAKDDNFDKETITKDTNTAKQDTNKEDNKVISGDRASVSIKLASYVKYDKVSLMYGRSKHPCKINVYCGDERVMSTELPETETFSMFRLSIPPNTRSFKIEFIANISPDFYGLLVDGDHGAQVDNYALRGHSGDGLMLIDPGYYELQMKALNIRLIIMQYGANVVPYIKTDKMCKWLEDCYVNTLDKLKRAAPDASIMVIGVGDMARKSEGASASYPILPKIRDAQKSAAMRTHCAFWDLLESMGGMNSIVTWSNQHLASVDGHLSGKGREIMAKEIFDALMIEYDFYRYKTHKKPV